MTNEPNPPRRLRYPALIEIVILGALSLVLMIALSMIRSVNMERAQRAANVRDEIASGWGRAQTIGGPVLIVPYRSMHYEPAKLSVVSHGVFLPDRLQVRGTLVPERRHRGIFETVVYRADLQLEGEFTRPDFAGTTVAPEDVLWDQAVIAVGVSDLRGMHGDTELQWNGKPAALTGGTPDTKLWPAGLTAPVALTAAAGARDRFVMHLHVNGSEKIAFVPVGGVTDVALTSPWPSPSFGGAVLPEARSVSARGFSAHWNVSSLARSYPQRWLFTGDEQSNALAQSAFDVSLFSPVGPYQKTERSLKYGALFIILTFVTFFLYELLSPVLLHPVQYVLVGGALCVFYLLLLSISEQARFGTAYFIASAATIALISAYGAALLRSALRVAGLAAVLTALYGYLYILLQLEDWALLAGSVGLFVMLAVIMWATRRVDWSSAHHAPAEA